MKFQDLASIIAKREGKKSEVKIADIREILGILTDLIAEEYAKGSFDIEKLLVQQAFKKAEKLRK